MPTMGALHEGHAALIRRARTLAGEKGSVAVSIFVNPLQFGPREDFSRYPRQLREDLSICRAQGADVVFAPPAQAMYAPDRSVRVVEDGLSRVLCGASRPGHFDGVCTVVAKLFHIVDPDIAVFGEKDWQQLTIIRRMVRDLDFPIRIVGHPVVREPDGLAMSSRNRYLTPEQRAQAPGIYAGLRAARQARRRGECRASALIRIAGEKIRLIDGAKIDYLQCVDAHTLQPVRQVNAGCRMIAAVWLGKARLIDNMAL